ncbi:DNA-3-methyladenine glycosylase 2 family protein [Nocardioides panacisoli]|uniref:DNA-3-methyladenine glycosylase 2 family protein n=2 Tax=Nocardioides panacisoli TaxID=627624 RepID=A0ABP7J4K0_9ACTN
MCVAMTSEATRTWRPDWPCPVVAILAQQRRGSGDPTLRLDVGGRQWRASRTPEGPATLALDVRRRDGEVVAEAWGPGAAWALAQLPDLLGAADDWSGFEPQHPVVAEAWRRHPHLRLGRTGLVTESLVPAVIEQRVTGKQAFAGFRTLVRRYGEPAPGPGADVGLWLQPEPGAIRAVPSWEWLRLGIDESRSRTVVTAARHATALERVTADPASADRRLRSLPGVGAWTSAEVRQRALGDPDAVSFGDFHVAKDVGWALTGTPVDDAEMAVLLEPWRPQRGRVPLLLGAAGLRRPRRGPRLAVPGHLPP